MKQIEFTHTGHSHALGNFAAGDVARVPDDLARHFVDDAKCAKYVEGVAPDVVPVVEPQTVKRGRKAKE